MRLGALERDLRTSNVDDFRSNNIYSSHQSNNSNGHSGNNTTSSNNQNGYVYASPLGNSGSLPNGFSRIHGGGGGNFQNSSSMMTMMNLGNGSSSSTQNTRLNRDASLIREQYTFLEEIGTGAFGRVYKAISNKNKISSSTTTSSTSGKLLLGGTTSSSSSVTPHHGSEVFAIKHVDKKKAGAAGLKSVLSEVETLALLNHPYIVRLEEVFQDKENLYIVMEMVPGGELASALKQLHRLHETIVRKIILCLLLALEYIHDQGIVHRDIKPANCLLSADGCTVKIADFGFAVMVGPTSCLTETCGTPAYLAPEIVCSENYGKQVDMWSLGVIMYLMLTGEYPFFESEKESLAECICRGKYSTSSKIWDSEISAGAKDFISKLLVTDPTRRWNAQQCLNHSWIRVARPGGGAYLSDGRISDGLYSSDDVDDVNGATLLSNRALSGIQRLQNAIAGGGGAQHNNGPVNRPKRGRMRLRIIFKGAIQAVRGALRLLFLVRLHTLRREGLDSIPMMRSFSFVVTRRYTPPNPTQMNCRAIAPGNLKVLTMVVTMFESCPTVEVLDLSNNKIESLELVQHIVRAVNSHPNLTVLNLDNNPIPPLAGRGLLRLARFHPSLRTLSCQGTNIGNDTITQIAAALKENEKKKSTNVNSNNNNNANNPSITSPSAQSLGGGGNGNGNSASFGSGGGGGSNPSPSNTITMGEHLFQNPRNHRQNAVSSNNGTPQNRLSTRSPNGNGTPQNLFVAGGRSSAASNVTTTSSRTMTTPPLHPNVQQPSYHLAHAPSPPNLPQNSSGTSPNPSPSARTMASAGNNNNNNNVAQPYNQRIGSASFNSVASSNNNSNTSGSHNPQSPYANTRLIPQPTTTTNSARNGDRSHLHLPPLHGHGGGNNNNNNSSSAVSMVRPSSNQPIGKVATTTTTSSSPANSHGNNNNNHVNTASPSTQPNYMQPLHSSRTRNYHEISNSSTTGLGRRR